MSGLSMKMEVHESSIRSKDRTPGIVVERFEDGQGTAVLLSGGLDSAVLLADAARHGAVQPVYVSVGLAWEPQERAMVDRLLGSGRFGSEVRPLVVLAVNMRDVYPAGHWAIRGKAPGFDSPDEDVYLEGRNIVLLAKTSVFMARCNLQRMALGPLACNPFPDASQEFFETMARALSIGLATRITIHTPLAHMHKADVIRLGVSLGVPLELTLSCMQPADGLHCGRCSKCRERRDGFREARVDDPTRYAVQPVR